MVVRGSAWEAASCTSRKGTPASSAAVMKACRGVSGPPGLASPALLATRRTIRPAPWRSSRTFSTVADIDSAAIGRLATVTSPQELTKAQAHEYGAARLITLIDVLVEVTPHMPPDLSGCLVQFLVAHLATKFAAYPSGHQAWARKRLLGLHLVHTPSRLLT
jgi:hypothetical protein